jgi:phosphoribosylaminoimidazole-succinocarboxamide synthase
MENVINSTDFHFRGQKGLYHGKVRDVYNINDSHLVMIATDRISAFDVILPRGIPYKGQVLNQIAVRFLDHTDDIVPNWKIASPDPTVTIGIIAKPIKIEMVIRGYLSGHAWREYKSGKREICGVPLPEGMRENDKFPEPIITPTTKAEEGHDLDLSREEILEKGLIYEKQYKLLEEYTKKLFKRGTKLAAEKGLILVDTKYEFGTRDGKIYLIDEIHTPDSSRYFYAEGYEDRQRRGERQKQFSKEFVREWLMENNFQGLQGQVVPDMSDEFVNQVSDRYIELYEKLLNEKFIKSDTSEIMERIKNNIGRYLDANISL